MFVSHAWHSLLDRGSIQTPVFPGNITVRIIYFAFAASTTVLDPTEHCNADLNSILNRFTILLTFRSSLRVRLA